MRFYDRCTNEIPHRHFESLYPQQHMILFDLDSYNLRKPVAIQLGPMMQLNIQTASSVRGWDCFSHLFLNPLVEPYLPEDSLFQ